MNLKGKQRVKIDFNEAGEFWSAEQLSAIQ
jgi:hypothetical protein